MWAVRTGRPILSIEYGKAPECLSQFLSVPFVPRADVTLTAHQIPTRSPLMSASTSTVSLLSRPVN